MSLPDFIKELNLIEQITDQIWVSLAVWLLFLYLVYEFQLHWILALILILAGFCLTVKALFKKFRQGGVRARATVFDSKKFKK